MAPDHKRFFTALRLPVWTCGALVGLFVWICGHFYLPGKGFTYLIDFGETSAARYLPELRAVNHYEVKGAAGYDAQYYAQIAMRPRLGDPQLRDAVDSLPYRARRILLSWVAWAAAGGDAVRAMHIYAVENIVCWFALAIMLCRWARPTTWEGLLRWTGVMFSFGLACSVRAALVDGPSLLLIAIAIALAESRRWWWSAAVLGVAGLAKETNLLALGILLPATLHRRSLSRAVTHGAVALAPLLLWLVVLRLWIGTAADPGARNFALPFAAYAGKWREIAAGYREHGWELIEREELLVLIGLSIQWAFIVFRPRWQSLWWRVAAGYALLAVFLGPAVWEGYPGAAARVLLPIAAGFCLLVPVAGGSARSRVAWGGVLLFLIGNAGISVTPDVLTPPGRESVTLRGPRELRIVPRTGQIVDAVFSPEWYGPEKSWLQYWRWCAASGTVDLVNPHPFPITVDVTFGLRANDTRQVAVRSGTRTLWMGTLTRGQLRPVAVPQVVLPSGNTIWHFDTAQPPQRASQVDARPLTFSLRDLRLSIRPPEVH